MGAAQGTAAPSELTIGGAAYRLRPLTYADIGEFERWAQSDYLAQQKRLVAEVGLEGDDRRDLLVASIGMAGKLSMTTDDPEASAVMAKISQSLEGVTRLMWLSMRKERAELTMEDVGEMMADPEAMGEALEQFNALNDNEGGAEGKEPTVRRPKPRKKASR